MLRCLVAVSLLSFATCSLAQRLALTFDDGLDPQRLPIAQDVNEALLDALDQAHVRAMFFPAMVKIGGDAGLPLVGRWSARGHWIGNHTYSHRSLSSAGVRLEDFTADAERADRSLAAIPRFRRMLRFPYLKEGNTLEKRDGIRQWMAHHGYRPAQVSIDTSDWYYDAVHTQLHATGDMHAQRELQQAYIDHLIDRARFYDGLARKVLGRSPDHVMLLHLTPLNAAALPQIVSRFEGAGWTFVDPVKAYEDPVYRSSPRVLPAGESIVWSLATEAGVPDLRYPAEDDRYEKPALRARGLPAP
jgi:peptidoglycan/xylan/chitin deacetylase (PgdA/CDA1 family)